MFMKGSKISDMTPKNDINNRSHKLQIRSALENRPLENRYKTPEYSVITRFWCIFLV